MSVNFVVSSDALSDSARTHILCSEYIQKIMIGWAGIDLPYHICLAWKTSRPADNSVSSWQEWLDSHALHIGALLEGDEKEQQRLALGDDLETLREYKPDIYEAITLASGYERTNQE